MIFKVTKPEQIPGKGKLNEGTMLSTVGLINAKTAALHPVKMSFRVAGPEQDLSLIETPNGRAQLDDLASRGSIGPHLERAPLNADDPTTYYGGGAKGYTDYPTLEQERGEAPKPCVDDRWR